MVSGRVTWLASVLGGALLLLWGLLALPGAAKTAVQTSSIIISEVAWSGTAVRPSHEWLELYNRGDTPVDVSGWTLTSSQLLATLSGVIQPGQFCVLERSEFALIDIASDYSLVGGLDDSGATIQLMDDSAEVVDTANIGGGTWPAGTASPDFRSMERAHPLVDDDPTGWVDNNGAVRNGLDANGEPVNGTPGMPNSTWNPAGLAEIAIRKSGPAIASAGVTIDYRLTVTNTGQISATNVIVSDTLPPAANFVADDGQFPRTSPISNTLVWDIGDLAPGAAVSISLAASIKDNFSGTLTNSAQVSMANPEVNMQNNRDYLVTIVPAPEPIVLIDAVYYDGYESPDLDEAVRLINVGSAAQVMGGWRLSDGIDDALFPAGIVLEPGEGIWIADRATNFRSQFGHDPDFEVRGSDPDVPNLEGTWPGFSNDGDEVLLLSGTGTIQDALVYENGDTSQTGWSGPAVEPYTLFNIFGADGQILHRMFGPDASSRVPDTDTALDWAQSRFDVVNGRRVRYPGWDIEEFYPTRWHTETAEVIVGIAPDNAFELLKSELAGATSEIRIASLTFRSSALEQELIAALGRGVSVTVLLEGDPVGGIEISQRNICQHLEDLGGQCWLMINDPGQDVQDRYRYMHAKYMIIDDKRAIISTENLSPDSFPDDDKTDGTWGRRGVVVVTDAPSMVQHLLKLWQHDFDPEHHRDLAPWSEMQLILEPILSNRAEIGVTSELTYSVRFSEPTSLEGEFAFAVVQSPENALDSVSGLLSLLARAGPGDSILVEELTERPHWGLTASNPIQDPNPRLEAIIGAARRGAKVRLLLDDFFDDSDSPVSNMATCRYVNTTAVVERLDLICRQRNPTGLGLHNKMILAEIDQRGYVFVGSINGTELSNKGNREVALLIQSDEAFALLSNMFTVDWPHRIMLPLIFNIFIGPADHLLISEVFYDPPGPDDAEFVELYNPTGQPIDLSGYSLGDALYKTDFEDVRRFPVGTFLDARSAIVVAATATGFIDEFGFPPDYEILDSDPLIPNLEDDKEWGDPAAILQLANVGDEVIVRDPSGQIIEAIAYGSGQLPGNTTCPLNTIAGAVLERYPPWRDTDDCPTDFREWPYPNPGIVP